MAGNRFIHYPVTNLPAPAGPASSDYYIGENEINENLRTVGDAIACRYVRGENAADTGASNATRCVIWLQAHGGERTICDVGAVVRIYYGSAGGLPTHIWTTTAQDGGGGGIFVEFSDAECIYPATPTIADYSDPSFIDALHIYVMTSGIEPLIPSSQLLLSANAPGGINAAVIPMTTGSDIETTMTSVQTAFAQGHDSVTGDHLANAIADITVINPRTFAEEGFSNLVWGDFVLDSNYDGLADRWLPIGSPTCSISTTLYRIGTSSQSITTTMAGEGIYAQPNSYYYHDHLGRPVCFAVYVYPTEDDTVYLEIDDGVGTTVSTDACPAGTWTRIGVTHNVNAAATQLYFRIRATKATAFNVDGAVAKQGRLYSAYVDGVSYAVGMTAANFDFVNYGLNTDFSRWTNGTSSLPDYWQSGSGGYNAPTVISRNATAWTGTYSMGLVLQLGEGAFIDIPMPGSIRYNTMLVSLYIYDNGGSGGKVTLEADNGVAVYTGTIDVAGEWRKIQTSIPANASASYLRVGIKNLDPGVGTLDILVDGLQVTTAGFSSVWKPQSVYKPVRWDFVYGGTIGSGLLYRHGIQQDVFPVPVDCVLDTIHIYHRVPSTGGGTDTYTVTRDGIATSLTTSIPSGVSQAAYHYAPGVAFTEGQRVQVSLAAGIPPLGQDAGVVVSGYCIEA